MQSPTGGRSNAAGEEGLQGDKEVIRGGRVILQSQDLYTLCSPPAAHIKQPLASFNAGGGSLQSGLL